MTRQDVTLYVEKNYRPVLMYILFGCIGILVGHHLGFKAPTKIVETVKDEASVVSSFFKKTVSKKETAFSKTKEIPITNFVKSPEVLQFLTHNEVLERAYQVQKETGLSTATVLAQKGLESRWGASKFCARTKNLSNIKCTRKECRLSNIRGLKKRGDVGSETQHCIQLYDDGPNDRYVKLDYFWQGWTKYRTLIKRRYSRAANKDTVKEEAEYLRKCGFATDKSYAGKIYDLAKNNGLIKLQQAIDSGCTITTQNGKYILLKPN